MSATDILEQIRRLPVEEQRKVVQGIQEEFEEDPTAEQIAEFEARAERLRRNPALGIPLEKVRSELKARLEQRRACPKQ